MMMVSAFCRLSCLHDFLQIVRAVNGSDGRGVVVGSSGTDPVPDPMKVVLGYERAQDHKTNSNVQGHPHRASGRVQERVDPEAVDSINQAGFCQVEEADGKDNDHMGGDNGHGVDHDLGHEDDQVSTMEGVVPPQCIRAEIHGGLFDVAFDSKVAPEENRDDDTNREEKELFLNFHSLKMQQRTAGLPPC